MITCCPSLDRENNLTKIKLNTDCCGIFDCDRIGGKREDIEALGFKIVGEESQESMMWDFESVGLIVPDGEFEVFLDYSICDRDSNGSWCGDIIFEHFTIGYVYLEDITIVSGRDVRKDVE